MTSETRAPSPSGEGAPLLHRAPELQARPRRGDDARADEARDPRLPGSTRQWTAVAILRLEAIAFAALSLGAAAIHFAVLSEHFAEDVSFGLFFAGVGWFEALWAIAYVLRPARLLAIVGLVGNGATVAVWIWAHLVGLPFGPDPGAVEPTTVTDLTATLFELVLAIWLGLSLAIGARAARMSPAASTIVVAALVLTVAVAASVAIVSQIASPEMAGG